MAQIPPTEIALYLKKGWIQLIKYICIWRIPEFRGQKFEGEKRVQNGNVLLHGNAHENPDTRTWNQVDDENVELAHCFTFDFGCFIYFHILIISSNQIPNASLQIRKYEPHTGVCKKWRRADRREPDWPGRSSSMFAWNGSRRSQLLWKGCLKGSQTSKNALAIWTY